VNRLPKRLLLLTGNPGIGKTTVLMKTISVLKEKGITVGGMVSREVREGGARVGFEILDLTSSQRGWLASINQKSGPQVGKYRVNIEDLNAIGTQALIDAVEKCQVIAIDEIGPMELFSEEFKQAAWKALDSRKLVIAVVHWKAKNILITAAKKREDAETITVTVENREKIDKQITEKALEFLKKSRESEVHALNKGAIEFSEHKSQTSAPTKLKTKQTLPFKLSFPCLL
jgi:nucleoside-triphosphatase